MWIFYGLGAGIILGFYDLWTKRAMQGNGVLQVVMWSSFFGALCWLPFAFTRELPFFVDVTKTSVLTQLMLAPKSLAMTGSWIFAYYAVRALPLSLAGAVRASGPLWTLLGGIVLFGEYLSAPQVAGLGLCIVAYYLLAVAGKRDGIVALRSLPVAMMILATVLSALTTVYDKYLVQHLHIPIVDIQFYSAFHRFLIAAATLLIVLVLNLRASLAFQWRWDVALVGVSWVVAELAYFLAYLEPDAMVTHLSVFRRASLIVGFIASVIVFKEQQIPLKSMMIALLLVGMGILILA